MPEQSFFYITLHLSNYKQASSTPKTCQILSFSVYMDYSMCEETSAIELIIDLIGIHSSVYTSNIISLCQIQY